MLLLTLRETYAFKQALQFQNPKTKGRQLWPPPWAAKGPATPLSAAPEKVLVGLYWRAWFWYFVPLFHVCTLHKYDNARSSYISLFLL